MQVHPYISALLAAEHVKDMRAQGSRGRRARAARRARRGVSVGVTHAAPAQILPSEPCPA
jgi:hypothetical protein